MNIPWEHDRTKDQKGNPYLLDVIYPDGQVETYFLSDIFTKYGCISKNGVIQVRSYTISSQRAEIDGFKEVKEITTKIINTNHVSSLEVYTKRYEKCKTLNELMNDMELRVKELK